MHDVAIVGLRASRFKPSEMTYEVSWNGALELSARCFWIRIARHRQES